MQDEWILDVLSDLKAFATENRLDRLAEQLQQSFVVAALELANREPEGMVGSDAGGAGQSYRLVCAGGHA
jgi:hypothetical protein